MTDRELVELAAKAAGYTLKWGETYIVGDDEVDCTDMSYVVSGQPDEADWLWEPLDDDGDALRLAVKLNIDLMNATSRKDGIEGQSVTFPIRGDYDSLTEWHDTMAEKQAATRRAIVRAAAEIGRAM